MPEPLPRDQLADPDTILGILGSFWMRTYAGREQARALCGAAGDATAQAQLDLFALMATLARATVPVYHRERWHVLYLRRSQQIVAVPTFGDAGVFGAELRFGATRLSGTYAWTCPLAGVATIFNRLTAPSRTLTCGLDFTLEAGRIAFRDDPFADPLLAARDLVDEQGATVDREVALWCFAADTDRQTLDEQFGYVLGLQRPSSETYRDLINAVFDALVGGTAMDQLLAALAAITGIPLVRAPMEVVQQTFRDAHGMVIVTDRNAYRFPATAVSIVMPGQEVHAGDPLVDTFEVRALNDGQVPAGLHSLTTDAGILAAGYYADLVWSDRMVPLHVESGPGRFTRVSWELGGYPADVEKFWDEVHLRGVLSGETLAHLLDIRAEPMTEPEPVNLPATINPLEFLIAQLLRGHAIFARIRSGSLGAAALGIDHVRLLRRIIPPHACLILLIDLPPRDDSANMGTIVEELAAYDAAIPMEEHIGRSQVQDGPSEIVPIAETCQ